jgi:two-component system chemotaxis response regulator CheB
VKGPIRLLIVDDSAAFRTAFAAALSRELQIVVVGQAGDGEEALRLIDRLHPDVVTMDVVMPKIDGLEASKRILASSRPLPVVLLSTLARYEEQRLALNALRLGVMDVTNKPVLVGADAAASIAAVVRLVKAAAAAQVVQRPRSVRLRMPTRRVARALRLIAVAASTGGPPALERLLCNLPASCPPVVVAQHLAPSFAAGFADWLASSIRRTVVTVSGVERLRLDTIYVAGESVHVRVRDGLVEAVRCGESELAPNADVLFHSAAALGAGALGVVLTGMGDDGAVGLHAMKAAGAWTIGQDADSSAVYGMPRAAYETGACCEQLSLDLIRARMLALLAGTDTLGIA